MQWQNKLTTKELRHVFEDAGCHTLAAFRANREGQKKLDPTKEVCWLCRNIAVTLGIERAGKEE